MLHELLVRVHPGFSVRTSVLSCGGFETVHTPADGGPAGQCRDLGAASRKPLAVSDPCSRSLLGQRTDGVPYRREAGPARRAAARSGRCQWKRAMSGSPLARASCRDRKHHGPDLPVQTGLLQRARPRGHVHGRGTAIVVGQDANARKCRVCGWVTTLMLAPAPSADLGQRRERQSKGVSMEHQVGVKTVRVHGRGRTIVKGDHGRRASVILHQGAGLTGTSRGCAGAESHAGSDHIALRIALDDKRNPLRPGFRIRKSRLG